MPTSATWPRLIIPRMLKTLLSASSSKPGTKTTAEQTTAQQQTTTKTGTTSLSSNAANPQPGPNGFTKTSTPRAPVPSAPNCKTRAPVVHNPNLHCQCIPLLMAFVVGFWYSARSDDPQTAWTIGSFIVTAGAFSIAILAALTRLKDGQVTPYPKVRINDSSV